METKKSLGEYWEHYWGLAKEWLEAHQHWLVWPFEQLSKLFYYVWNIVQNGSSQERVFLAGVVLAMVAGGYVLFMIGLREVLIRLPGFNRVPFGLPGSDDYLVKPTGYDRPVDFEWRYPNLWVSGTQFDFGKAMLDTNDTLLFYLKTGTEVRFVAKAHKLRGKG
jgi:hypothetical protein